MTTPLTPRIIFRILYLILPFIALYGYAQYTFAQAHSNPYHGDTGLGIALLMGLIVIALLLGFIVDVIKQSARKIWALLAIDIIIICLLLLPFAWVGCHWFGDDNLFCRIIPYNAMDYVFDLVGL